MRVIDRSAHYLESYRSFLLTKQFFLLAVSCNRAHDPGTEYSVETSAGKQNDAQVGEENCTNQQLW